MSRSRRSLLLLLVAAALVLTGCRADVTVAVDVDEEGGGTVDVTVVLDADAVARTEGIEDPELDDLVEAGWTVADPVEREDGGLELAASKPFADPTELGAVLREVSGPAGPYAQLGLAVDRPFGRTEMRFEGILDGTAGVESFADPEVAAALDGLPFGQDLTALEQELGAPIGSFVGLDLEVTLPGDPGDEGEPADEVAVWSTDLAADGPVPVLSTSEMWRMQPLLLAGAAALLVVLLVLLVLVKLVISWRRRRRRRREAKAERRRVAEAGSGATDAPVGDVDADADDTDAVRVVPAAVDPDVEEDADTSSAAAPAPASVSLDMVVLGGPGTTFGVRDQVDQLVAFARAKGSTLEYPKIADRYVEASRGALSSAELWAQLGVDGDPDELDAEMLGRYALTPGLREFVVRARERGYAVAYVGDGPASWAAHLRRTFRLDDLVDPWVVSADIGAVLPSIALFEGLRRISGVNPPNCLLIDDRLRVLEAARELGYGTAWYTPSGRAAEAPGHSIIRSFADLMSG
ncbi:HAD family hydrolase [Actinomarinicola tropica]|uniref:HAD-IA family hydrolase n=1 Tax=Actinomarinicola tropica TaxID=2789776 RepID=A0A5Q2RNG0_9ACTN|nr:hypothetical protein [Actinomarinicola tropica]QGG96482.1 hypothetical protein GH723_15995 [Actinomarinicola tropica]